MLGMLALPLIPEPSGRSFIISSISFSSKAEADPAGLMVLASEIPAWLVSEWDRPLVTHSEADVDEAGDKLETEGGVRLCGK